MTRNATFWILTALICAAPAAADAGSFRAGPLGAWDQNGEVSCQGGDMLLFPGGEFAVIPRAGDETAALIDSRSGRAKVGGNTAADLAALQADPEICAGPIDCDDWEGIDRAMQDCWTEPDPGESGPAFGPAPL
jgi:hypothetical protein